jgi:hypothetical protein
MSGRGQLAEIAGGVEAAVSGRIERGRFYRFLNAYEYPLGRYSVWLAH